MIRFKKLIFLFNTTQHQNLVMATFLELILHRVHGVLADLLGPPRAGLPGEDGVNGIGLCKGQNPPQGRLRHLKLLPDSTERHPCPPQLNGGTLGVLFEDFPIPFPHHCHLAAELENA